MEYPIYPIGPGLWEINEFDGASIFLVQGRERALLIDTGIGIGDLRAFAEERITTPYEVFLTHNHRDHVGGAPLFDRVWMSREDQAIGPMLRPRTSMESRLQFARNTRKTHPDRNYPWTEADLPLFRPEDEPEMLTLRDGQVFDLGGRKLTAHLVPGHSVGSMVLIDDLTHTLFAGDAVNCNIGMGIAPAGGIEPVVTVREGLEALRRLGKMDFDHSRIFNGHSDYRPAGQPLEPWVFPEAIAALEDVMGGAVTETVMSPTLHTDIDVYLRGGIRIRFNRNNLGLKEGGDT